MKWIPPLVVAGILTFMVWLGAESDNWRLAYSFTGQKTDYYNLLVDGFRDGHLYMKAPVHPDLLSPDPAVRKKAPYVLDASLYHGRYYLYFGVVPAALLFLPYAILTGHDLPGNAAGLLMVALGFYFSSRIFREAKHRYFPGLSTSLEILCLLLLGFATAAPILLVSAGGVYEEAIAGAYACLSAALWCIFRAFHADRRAGRWLGLASLGSGLAVGCRPTFIVALPALLGAAVYLARRDRNADDPPSRRAAAIRLAGAAIIPAGLVGLLLMAYNYGRFGDPFELGHQYQLCAMNAAGAPVASWSFILPNIRWYYLTPPVISPFFPYTFPIDAAGRPADYFGYESVHGQWLALLLLLWCLAGLGWLLLLRQKWPRNLSSYLALLGTIFCCLFLATTPLGVRADRYAVDFQGTLTLLLALLGGFCACPARASARCSRLWRGIFGLLALLATTCNVLNGFQIINHFALVRPRTFRLLAYYGNYPSHLLAKCGLYHYGSLRFHVVFAPQDKVVIEPLVVTGTPGYNDVLHVTRLAPNLISFSVEHAGYGSCVSDPLPVVTGREYQVEVDLGSLYPPRLHPCFRGWDQKSIDKLKTTTRVLLDGREILRGRLQFYDSPPSAVYFGRDPWGTDPPFAGRIYSQQRLPPRDLNSLGLYTETGLWRFRIEFPFHVPRVGQPVLGSGVTGNGNLLFLVALGNRAIQFHLDQWNYGDTASPPLEIHDPGPHTLEVFVGPQVILQKLPAAWRLDAADLQASAGLQRVWLDGEPIWTTAILGNKDTYDFVSIGSNPQGFSDAGMTFAGALKSIPYPQDEMKEFLERNLRETRRAQHKDRE